MAKNEINERCPLQSECGRKKCEFKFKEAECDYYFSNSRPGYEIAGQKEPKPSIWDESAETSEVAVGLTYIPIEELYPHPDNPRKDLGDITELADSIKAKGILQNLTVVPGHAQTALEWEQFADQYNENPSNELRQKMNTRHYDTGYTVIIGHRRLAAAKIAGVTVLPCVVTEMSPQDQIATMLLENMQRSDLTVYEQAKGFQMMLDFGETVESVAEKSGFSQTTIRRRLKIAELDDDTLRAVSGRQVDLADYDKLNQIEDMETRNKVLADIGTSNFDNAIKKALEAQKIMRIRKQWGDILTKYGAVKIGYDEAYDAKYAQLGYVEGEPDEKTVKEYKEKYGKLYYAYGYGSTIYIRGDKIDGENEEIIAARKEQEQRAMQRNKLEELGNRAFKLRFDFIKNYNFSDSKKNIKKITDWMCLREIVSMMCVGMFTGIIKYEASQKRFNELFGDDLDAVKKFIDNHPEKALLMNVYAQWCDSEDRDCYDWDLRFKENEMLTLLYQCLCNLGYEMSDEEKAMVTGTHELYNKERSEEIDTADDVIEEENDIDDDTFDKEIKSILDESMDGLANIK